MSARGRKNCQLKPAPAVEPRRRVNHVQELHCWTVPPVDAPRRASSTNSFHDLWHWHKPTLLHNEQDHRRNLRPQRKKHLDCWNLSLQDHEEGPLQERQRSACQAAEKNPLLRNKIEDLEFPNHLQLKQFFLKTAMLDSIVGTSTNCSAICGSRRSQSTNRCGILSCVILGTSITCTTGFCVSTSFTPPSICIPPGLAVAPFAGSLHHSNPPSKVAEGTSGCPVGLVPAEPVAEGGDKDKHFHQLLRHLRCCNGRAKRTGSWALR